MSGGLSPRPLGWGRKTAWLNARAFAWAGFPEVRKISRYRPSTKSEGDRGPDQTRGGWSISWEYRQKDRQRKQSYKWTRWGAATPKPSLPNQASSAGAGTHTGEMGNPRSSRWWQVGPLQGQPGWDGVTTITSPPDLCTRYPWSPHPASTRPVPPNHEMKITANAAIHLSWARRVQAMKRFPGSTS